MDFEDTHDHTYMYYVCVHRQSIYLKLTATWYDSIC